MPYAFSPTYAIGGALHARMQLGDWTDYESARQRMLEGTETGLRPRTEATALGDLALGQPSCDLGDEPTRECELVHLGQWMGPRVVD
jgi:hypothetical protein